MPQTRVRGFVLWIFANAKNARQHPDDVSVQDRRGLIEGDAANRTGGVAADAGEGEDVLERVRKFADERNCFGGLNLSALSFPNGRGSFWLRMNAKRLLTPALSSFWEGEGDGIAASSCAIRNDFLRRLLHVAHSGVIAEAFPEFVNGLGLRVGER